MLAPCTGVLLVGMLVSKTLGNRCAFERSNEQWKCRVFKTNQPCQRIPDYHKFMPAYVGARCLLNLATAAKLSHNC